MQLARSDSNAWWLVPLGVLYVVTGACMLVVGAHVLAFVGFAVNALYEWLVSLHSAVVDAFVLGWFGPVGGGGGGFWTAVQAADHSIASMVGLPWYAVFAVAFIGALVYGAVFDRD